MRIQIFSTLIASAFLGALAVGSTADPSVTQPTGGDELLLLTVLMDTSGSMQVSDPGGATQEAVYTAMNLIAHERPTVCILEFSGQVHSLVEPQQLTLEALDSMRQKVARRKADGYTYLDRAIQESDARMRLTQFQGHRKAVLVLSDGQVPAAQNDEIRKYAEQWTNDGIKVFCIALGVQQGEGNILETLAGVSGGRFFGIRADKDLVTNCCQAAVQIAIGLMPNNIHSFTDDQSPLRVPREARRLLVVAPSEATLIGPGGSLGPSTAAGAGTAIQLTETRYAGWKVIGVARPSEESVVDRFWEGEWFAVDARSNRVKTWALMYTDLSVNAQPVDTEPTAEEHIRVVANVTVSADSIPLKPPHSLRVYLKPSDGPAYGVVEEALTGGPPRRVELELAPVDNPGQYELVCQVLNAAGILTAEHRQPVAIEPSQFQIVVSAVTPEGVTRTLMESGTGRKPMDLQLRPGETVTVEIEPLAVDHKGGIELLSGGITLDEQGKPSVTRTLQVDRSGPVPRLCISGLVINGPTEICIDARKVIRILSQDPVTGITSYSTRETGARWGFGLQPPQRVLPTGVQIVASFRLPDDVQEGQLCSLTSTLHAAGGTPTLRTTVLRAAAAGVDLIVTQPDGTRIRTPASPRLARTATGPVERAQDGSELSVTWSLTDPAPGEYIADLQLPDPNSCGGGKIPVLFVSEGGRFKVRKPWIVVALRRTNRAGGTFPLRDGATLLAGDEGVFEVTATDEVPSRIIDYMQVNISLQGQESTSRQFTVNRVGRNWQSEKVTFMTGAAEAYVTVTVPSGSPIVVRGRITVRQLGARLVIESPIEDSVPQDTLLVCGVRVIPDQADDLPVLVREQQVTLRLADEAGQVVLEHEVRMNSEGVAIANMTLPRSGRFLLTAAMDKGVQTSKTLDVGQPAVAFKMRSEIPSPDIVLTKLLAEPATPPRLMRGTAIFPVLVPTEAFPVDQFRIVEVTLEIDGQRRSVQSDGLSRWYSPEPIVVGSNKRLTGTVDVTLANVSGGRGMVIHQNLDIPLSVATPWYSRLFRYAGLLLLVFVVLLVVCRRYFALGELTITVAQPFLPDYANTSTAESALKRMLWPRTQYTVGVGTGQMNLDPALCDTPPGRLATMRRDLRRRLLLWNHFLGEKTLLLPGYNIVPLQGIQLEILCPLNGSAEAVDQDDQESDDSRRMVHGAPQEEDKEVQL